MIFAYYELKEYVNEDFERFYKMRFNEKQILSAVLDEYKHGKDFCQTENICIHILLGMNYAKKGLSVIMVKDKLEKLINEDAMKEIEVELGCEYAEFISDLGNIMVQ